MEAKLDQRGDILVVHVSGQLDLEKSQNFRDVCLKNLKHKKLVFSLEGLQFVGSSGIQTFFRALNEIHASNPFGLRVTGLKADFQRLFQYTATAELKTFSALDEAVYSFQESSPQGATGGTEDKGPATAS